MKLAANALYALGSRHFGLPPAHAARYGRFAGEARVGFPQGRPGRRGGVFVETAEQLAVYLLALAASPTALDAGEAVGAYRGLVSYHSERPRNDVAERHEELVRIVTDQEARLEELQLLEHYRCLAEAEGWSVGPSLSAIVARRRELLADFDKYRREYEKLRRNQKPLPEVLTRLRDGEHTLLEALTWLVDAARTEDARERLRGTVQVRVERSFAQAEIVVDDYRSGWKFSVLYFDPDHRLFVTEAQKALGHQGGARFTCIVTDEVIRDFGALLDTSEAVPASEGAPSAEADGAPSSTVSRRANAGTRLDRDPRANGDSPDLSDGQSNAVEARFLPERPVGSRPLRISFGSEDRSRHDRSPPGYPRPHA